MKKTVFLTGATGIMGRAGFQELLSRSDKFDITLLVRPSLKNRIRMRKYAKLKNVRIVWGDLTCYEDVLDGVTGADYVLHVGGMVSPKADPKPKTTRAVNVLGADNIVRAIKAQPFPDRIKTVYIGSVAQTGDRNPPLHWGRTGDPINISIYDHYAVTKTIAERIFAESGLKYWVSLRQSGILYGGILKNFNPIMFHVPLRGVLEWATVEDSGRLLANVCEDWVPENFWRGFYNIGSGEQFRLTNYHFECLTLKAAHCPPPEKIFEAHWFARRNFHGQWFEDSDKLDDILHFREKISCDEYFRRMSAQLPFYFKLAGLVPAPVIKFFIKRLASSAPFGILHWMKTGDKARISAYIGNPQPPQPTWKDIDLSRPSPVPLHLNHGYDESKPLHDLTIEDMRQAAEFRGGECLTERMDKGALDSLLEWRCQNGHVFHATARLVLLGGHWCDKCLPMPAPWNYDSIAAGNPFFAQVWEPFHSNENNRYEASELDDWEKQAG